MVLHITVIFIGSYGFYLTYLGMFTFCKNEHHLFTDFFLQARSSVTDMGASLCRHWPGRRTTRSVQTRSSQS